MIWDVKIMKVKFNRLRAQIDSNMYKKYRKKPVIIEAIQWDGKNLVDVSAFLCNQTRKEALK